VKEPTKTLPPRNPSVSTATPARLAWRMGSFDAPIWTSVEVTPRSVSATPASRKPSGVAAAARQRPLTPMGDAAVDAVLAVHHEPRAREQIPAALGHVAEGLAGHGPARDEVAALVDRRRLEGPGQRQTAREIHAHVRVRAQLQPRYVGRELSASLRESLRVFAARLREREAQPLCVGVCVLAGMDHEVARAGDGQGLEANTLLLGADHLFRDGRRGLEIPAVGGCPGLVGERDIEQDTPAEFLVIVGDVAECREGLVRWARVQRCVVDEDELVAEAGAAGHPTFDAHG
jgi:hypothetical protein